MSVIKDILELLDKNKAFPNYQSERRIDIFINLYLEEAFSNYFSDNSIIKYICPEFPLKNEENNLSTKVDYLCSRTINSMQEILFVELKTDELSFRDKQIQTYLSRPSWGECVKGLALIIKTSKQKTKYQMLFQLIKDCQIPDSSMVRTLYIAPLPKKKVLNFEITNPKQFTKLIHSTKDTDKSIILEFIDKWDLFVFEIKNKS